VTWNINRDVCSDNTVTIYLEDRSAVQFSVSKLFFPVNKIPPTRHFEGTPGPKPREGALGCVALGVEFKKSLVNSRSTSNQSSKPCAMLQYPSRKKGVLDAGWPRPIGCLKLQVIFCNGATNYRALVRKMTYRDKAFYWSSPSCRECYFESRVQTFLSESWYWVARGFLVVNWYWGGMGPGASLGARNDRESGSPNKCVCVALLNQTNTGEWLLSQGFLESKPRDVHPLLRITDGACGGERGSNPNAAARRSSPSPPRAIRLTSRFYRISGLPGMEKSHSGCPRTAWRGVKYFS